MEFLIGELGHLRGGPVFREGKGEQRGRKEEREGVVESEDTKISSRGE